MLDFVFNTYKEEIKDFLGTTDVSVSFFSGNEELVDKLEGLKEGKVNQNGFKIKFLQDYSIKEDKQAVTDFSYCYLGDKRIIKVVVPFLFERSYDFLIGKSDEMQDILKELHKRQVSKNFKFNEEAPIIGFDFTEIEEESIKFLMNDEFRAYCKEHHIKLKRGIILQGKPGTGKTLTLQYLRRESEKQGIEYRQFKTIKDFTESINEYYEPGKKIFVFEDFDAALTERDDRDKTPSEILGVVLNILEGVEEVNDVVSIFTTNNIQVFDKAFIRPGRIDKVFDYDLPTEKEYLAFFEAYIREDKQFFPMMIEHLKFLSADVSYAMLKGICDDINIYKFSNVELEGSDILDIIKNKVEGASKGKKEKSTKDYIL